jgi:hypothetical protein
MGLVCTHGRPVCLATVSRHRVSAPQLDPENEVLKSVVAAVLQPVPASFDHQSSPQPKATPEGSNPKVDWVLE